MNTDAQSLSTSSVPWELLCSTGKKQVDNKMIYKSTPTHMLTKGTISVSSTIAIYICIIISCKDRHLRVSNDCQVCFFFFFQFIHPA